MKINYLFEGDGDRTIVFIHGLSDSLNYWMRLASCLKNDYRVLLYDLRGHGKSDMGSDDFSMDMFTDDLHSLFVDLDIADATLVGLSMGGNIALSFAVKYPQLVDALVLMSTSSEVDSRLKSKFLEFRQAIDISFEEFYDVIIRYVLPDDILKANADALNCIKFASAKRANVNAIKSAIDVGIAFDVTSRLSEIDCPALILYGRDDEIISLELQKVMKNNIRDSRMVVFDDTRHNLLIERNFDEILKLIRDFA